MPSSVRSGSICLLLLLFTLMATAQRTARKSTIAAKEERTPIKSISCPPFKFGVIEAPVEVRVDTPHFRCCFPKMRLVAQKQLIDTNVTVIVADEVEIIDEEIPVAIELIDSTVNALDELEVIEEVIEDEVVKVDKKGVTIPDCRETNRINRPNIADAYPYITADGLRLYFTSNREGGHGRFYISTRKSINDPFGEAQPLSPQLIDGFYAGTLTNDELTLCMVKSGQMYISVRKSIRDEFPTPVTVKGQSKNYHFGPSISPDGNEIIVMETVDKEDRIAVYKRMGRYDVIPAGELPLPDGEAGPGQFSKDGLSYYFSIETSTEEEYLWKYSRSSLTHDFADLEQLPVQMKALKESMQPTVSAGGAILVFVTSTNDSWSNDDIVLVNNTNAGFNAPESYTTVVSNEANSLKLLNKLVTPELKVYPNPFTATIIIDMNVLPGENTWCNLYNMSGKKIRQERITSSKTSLLVETLIPGMYIYHIVDGKGKLISSGKLVKGE